MSKRRLSAAAGLLIAGAGFLLAGEFRAREAARNGDCISQLKQIGLALMNYQNEYRCLPPAYTRSREGSLMHSWRAVGFSSWKESGMREMYDFSHAWNEGPNSRLVDHDTTSFFYWCPSGDGRKSKLTDYVAVTGPHTAWPGDRAFSLSDIGDDPSNTILLVEVENSGIYWMEPRDFTIEELIAGASRLVRHEGHFNALFADGSVRRISKDISADALKSLVTVDGGEPAVDWKRGY